jgi:hydrogenase maturation factor
MRIEDRLLFLKYALPCAGAFIRRGNVSQGYVDGLIKMVAEGNVPAERAETMFKVADAQCEAIATKEGKSSIDSDVIREYFLVEHSRVVDDRFELMRDFDPVACKTYVGVVRSIGSESAVVETRLGKGHYKTLFARGVKVGDKVITHYDFVIEKVSADAAKWLQKVKQ